jgi:adenylyltransferase/sulfurtransferase
MSLTEEEVNRYSRQLRLPEVGVAGQEKLKAAKVLVIGAGGLGSPVIFYLSAAGVGTIGVVDYDLVDVTNLQRQILYSIDDYDKPKPLAAAERVKLLNPNVTIKPHFLKLSKKNILKLFKDYDVIVDCTDNFSTRYLINDACVIADKPLVYGAVFKFEGQVTIFNYKNGPTLRCLYPEPPHPLEVPSCAEAGVIGCIAGIIGGLQANETIKLILGVGDLLSGKIFTLQSLYFHKQLIPIVRDPVASDIKELGNYEDYCLSGDANVKQITYDDLLEMISENKKVQVIDIREPDKYKDFGVKSINIPYYEIADKIHLISKDQPVVFYCTFGVKSENVINYLQSKYKFENLYSLINIKSLND